MISSESRGKPDSSYLSGDRKKGLDRLERLHKFLGCESKKKKKKVCCTGKTVRIVYHRARRLNFREPGDPPVSECSDWCASERLRAHCVNILVSLGRNLPFGKMHPGPNDFPLVQCVLLLLLLLLSYLFSLSPRVYHWFCFSIKYLFFSSV